MISHMKTNPHFDFILGIPPLSHRKTQQHFQRLEPTFDISRNYFYPASNCAMLLCCPTFESENYCSSRNKDFIFFFTATQKHFFTLFRFSWLDFFPCCLCFLFDLYTHGTYIMSNYCTRYLTNSTVFRLDFWISEEFARRKKIFCICSINSLFSNSFWWISLSRDARGSRDCCNTTRTSFGDRFN